MIQFNPQDFLNARHIGPTTDDTKTMLKFLGYSSLDDLTNTCVPQSIQLKRSMDIGPGCGEFEALSELKKIMSHNQVFKSYIGMGYSGTITPPIIQRNILENPGWYTQYTPYQAEISQGRLEALLNFQTMICDLTGFTISNSSLLDEGTAAAEAMTLSHSTHKQPRNKFFVANLCNPQTIEVIKTRAIPLGFEVVVDCPAKVKLDASFFGAIIPYPNTDGSIYNQTTFVEAAHQNQIVVTMICDLLSLTMLKTPAEMGADIAVGNSQRFGVPYGYGGPHAAFFATKDEYKRMIPGRIVGISKDSQGKDAIRLALQTREQHIRREKATSNICTAQVLLAIMASMYAVYHGPKGLRAIAERVHGVTNAFTAGLRELGYTIQDKPYFDTVCIKLDKAKADLLMTESLKQHINLRRLKDDAICVAFDETITSADFDALLNVFAKVAGKKTPALDIVASKAVSTLPKEMLRTSSYLTHPNFNSFHSETEMLRYLNRLQAKDISLAFSMIPLGSCTMKLNATSEMIPVTWPEVANIHPFAPLEQAQGYMTLFTQLENWLAKATGFDAVSLQPNAGSQGEYAGLLVIRKHHETRGELHRNICLIPTSAHGTNPASAVMAGMQVVAVACDSQGNIDVADLKAKAELHAKNLSCIMVTYPSTHGVFESSIREICEVVHKHGGQVYMDGANMNAQVGLCQPGEFGPDVCHLNLHKTFCIPHGGGGPGMGPIAVKKHLAPYLPGNQTLGVAPAKTVGAVSSANWGSASILPISWMYIRTMGDDGLKKSTQMAILNANYIAKRLAPYYPTLYTGNKGLVAHECIIDLRGLKEQSGIDAVTDVAKRLMDYGYHAPTMSWPVIGTLMIEPTESESKAELDRFCDAMIQIRKELDMVISKKWDTKNNPLVNSPHTAEMLLKTEWIHPYSREEAAFPLAYLRNSKFWPPVGRVDNAYGDRNLVCICPTVEELSQT